MAIIWTKDWSGADDGTILGGIDLKNIQDDLSNVAETTDPLVITGQTQGDVLYFNTTAWVRLPAGTAGEVLTTQGGGANPTWTVPTASDLTITGQSLGDILFFDGTDWVVIPPGTAGQVLTSNGPGVAPSYQTPTPNTGTSDVVFSWAGVDHLTAASDLDYGIVKGVLQSPTALNQHENIFYESKRSNNTSFFNLIDNIYWVKIAGISTLTVYARVWNSVVNHQARLDVGAGAATGDSVTYINSTPANLAAFTCDVSGLSNGTLYEIILKTRMTGLFVTGWNYCSSLLITGS